MFGDFGGGAAIHEQLVSVSFHRVKQSFVLGIYPVYPNTKYQVYLAKQTSLGICEAFASCKTPKSNVPYVDFWSQERFLIIFGGRICYPDIRKMYQ